MSLYYEPDPANENDPPLLPPILTPIPVVNGIDVFAKAIAVAGKSETGTVLYSENPEYVEVAIILSPEIPKIKCNQMLYIMMVASGDAIGALAPPEVAVTYAFPGFIFLNRGEAGLVKVEIAPSNDDQSIPDWMVVGLKLRLNNNIEINENEINADVTSLADEGGGYVSRTRAIESLSRHFLAWVSQWEDEGFKPVTEVWNKRREETKVVTLKSGQEVSWVGLDENGLAIVKSNAQELFLSPIDIIEQFGDIDLT
ncbi:MAG: biotin/lipoate--protein ligase family protein [Alphaproteobacteria bacterium]|jgi:biotin-(acetyl-CoA carboxylase) ligase|nr:biotin/lipoate--protein ligase family protein [Alphaproteobacteria bacterium]MDG1981914.1 biotin/lipoate--protein ligase family protein [Alphaproteobacteria bacterium]MDG2458145.1 biotin/lipoate--protein ligase family protein [Alphaproteobacteria bacterium]|tara:strand:- start:3223 stop:3987 length:765 start_codon:yes stop_codon:yes gene_type:complete